jgi:hypothetical protein
MCATPVVGLLLGDDDHLAAKLGAGKGVRCRHDVEEHDFVVVNEGLEVATDALDRLTRECFRPLRENDRDIEIAVERPGDHSEECPCLTRLDFAEQHAGTIGVVRVLQLIHDALDAGLKRFVVAATIPQPSIESHVHPLTSYFWRRAWPLIESFTTASMAA